MFKREHTIYRGDTNFEHYEVVDMVYEGRPARVLFTNRHRAAQSGIATDKNPALLFDYNQRFFELAQSLRPQNILIVGGGAYTLPLALASELPQAFIDVIEIDPGLDAIASGFFGFKPNDHLRIIHADGRDYLDKTSQKYDLIIIDVFMGTEVPYEFLTLEATVSLQHSLTPHGTVAMNVIGIFNGSGMKLKSLIASYQHVFKQTKVHPADPTLSLLISQNFIILGQNTDNLRYAMQSPSLSVPDISIDAALFDNPHTVTLLYQTS